MATIYTPQRLRANLSPYRKQGQVSGQKNTAQFQAAPLVTSDQTDYFIAGLKQEIYDLRQRQRDHTQLQDQYLLLTQKYEECLRERVQSEYFQCYQELFEQDCELRIQDNHNEIAKLIDELDNLKEINSEVEIEQTTLLVQNTDLFQDNQKSEFELKSVLLSLDQIEKANFIEQREIVRLDEEMRQGWAVADKYKQEIQRLLNIQNSRLAEIKQLEDKLQRMQSESEQNKETIVHKNEVKDQLEADLSDIASRINHAYGEIQAAKTRIQSLSNEIHYFEEMCDKLKYNQQHLNKLNEQEYHRQREISGIQSEKMIVLQQREDEFLAVRDEVDRVKESNGRINSDQISLENEVVALQQHVALITQQNYEVRNNSINNVQLSSELEHFIETDDAIRRSLNRRNKVDEIKTKVDDAIMRSIYEVEQKRSPDRRQRRENPSLL